MVSISAKVDWNKAILDRLKAAAKVNSVDVGIPEGKEYPNGKEVAEIAVIQEFGTARIPPRPFIRPTIEKRKGHWYRKVKDGIVHCFNEGQFQAMYADLGKAMVSNLQQAIDKVNTPPLSDYTKKRRQAKGNNSTKPLIDSGTMRDSISYRVGGEEGEWQS